MKRKAVACKMLSLGRGGVLCCGIVGNILFLSPSSKHAMWLYCVFFSFMMDKVIY